MPSKLFEFLEKFIIGTLSIKFEKTGSIGKFYFVGKTENENPFSKLEVVTLTILEFAFHLIKEMN